MARVPLFWRFQVIGWAGFLIGSLPLRWMIFETWPAVVAFTVSRDVPAFLLTLGLREIYRRFQARRLGPAAGMGFLIVVSLVAGALLTLWTLFMQGFHGVVWGAALGALPTYQVWYLCTTLYLVWSLLYFGISFVRDSAERDIRLARAEAEQTSAELQMLRAQMNPHFLFNALNTIRAGVIDERWQTEEVVQSLAEYLRFSLKHRDDDFIPLGEEFDALRHYLKAEKARFRDKLEVECRIDDSARKARVPGVLLQPLVENAIKHGRETADPPIRVEVDVRQVEDDAVEIAVSNSGHWIESRVSAPESGVGLANLRSRLKLLYGRQSSLQIVKKSDPVTACVRIPFCYGGEQDMAGHSG